MKSLWKQIQDLTFEIAGEVDHGECFYDESELYGFLRKLDRLKELSIKYYIENMSEMEGE